VAFRQPSQPEAIQAPVSLDLAEYGRHDRLARDACPGDFPLVQGACFAGLVLCARRASRARSAPPGAAGRATGPMDGPCVQSFPHAVVRHTRTAQECLQEYLLEGPRKSPGRAGICQLPPAQAASACSSAAAGPSATPPPPPPDPRPCRWSCWKPWPTPCSTSSA
jgi:hypothetical protein